MTQEPKDDKPAKFEWIKPQERIPEIYGNFYNVSWTLFDVRVQIGQLIPKVTGEPDKGFFVEERAAITFAWPEAKALRDGLVELVARYEEANGEIKKINLPAPSKS
jgi:hypothetical protein